MEKLSKLLDEYLQTRPKNVKRFMEIALMLAQSEGSHLYQIILISKDFGFIERLSENNKINFHKSVFTSDRSCDRDDIFYEMHYNNNLNIINEQYGVQEPDCIIMYLSVEENPVETLIGMLR